MKMSDRMILTIFVTVFSLAAGTTGGFMAGAVIVYSMGLQP